MSTNHKLKLKSKYQGELEVTVLQGLPNYFTVEESKDLDEVKHFISRHQNVKGEAHLENIEYYIDGKRILKPKQIAFNKAATKFLIQT